VGEWSEADSTTAGDHWGLHLPEAGGLGLSPKPPKARESGGEASSARRFLQFFNKTTLFTHISAKIVISKQ